ncbi:carboxylating nicotinate-nucleotide diphosphorylase [Rossellomorea vietnamensis]|uniref:Probable nicotinate-nucleotide pyrophosphorylase [carboxylating] n=1 Tax=Rossellomorea vietnamensis TaxID=218284 RepID=A0A5D4MGP1_9BACI|nr:MULTISPECIES: carboxylating nicotinate-nucleotide diphosphorylase [Bacillaceae]TYS00893.1 carboxylating nicotinate-nucleotide diphosphorylase [Rossellomorea vietnamensis]
MNKLKLKSMLEQFYLEDLGDGDLSSQALFTHENQSKFHFIAKEPGVFCGREVILAGFKVMNPDILVNIYSEDGEEVEAGTVIAEAFGPSADLLQAERVILNLVQRMSGIATQTARVVELVKDYPVRICDTRKTTPGLRMLEKYAVRCGGGFNHRSGLYDAVMLKDNHISFKGSISSAVKEVKSKLGHTVKVEVEIETRQGLHEAVESGADIIMFDNRTPEEISEWLGDVPPHIITEASGGIGVENVVDYAKTGVHYISLGFLTHSVTGLDISAKVLN